MSDSELMDLVPFLETLSKVDNVYSVLRNCNNPLNSQTPPQQQQGSQVLTQISQGPMTQVQPSPPPLITQQHQQEQQQQQYQKDYEEGKDGPSWGQGPVTRQDTPEEINMLIQWALFPAVAKPSSPFLATIATTAHINIYPCPPS